MQLNMDYVRSILLSVEQNTDYHRFCCFFENSDNTRLVNEFLGKEPLQIPDYQAELEKQCSNDELMYHVQYCVKAGLLESSKNSLPGEICVSDLSPAGHSFLENIRSDNNWSRIKRAAKKVGSLSLDALIQIASNVITEIIHTQSGL